MDAVLAGLHRALVQALRQRGPEAAGCPVTVEEIYQELIPYRSVRQVLGLDLVADYEDALLRLLAGTGGYVRLEPEDARERILEELSSPNPDLGLYRKFSACEVWVAGVEGELNEPPGFLESAPSGVPAAPGPVGTERVDRPTGSRAVEAVRASSAPPASRRAPGPAGSAEPPARRPSAPAAAPAWLRCPSCEQPLPGGRPVRYCPYCGAGQETRPCPRCGESLEADWRFCITCGSPAGP
jgi:hypothetical protein